jgi:DNA-binding MarR family transcriptional regulator
VPELEQARQLQEFAEEIFELSKDVWASQTRSKAKDQTEITETEFLALDLLVKSQPLSVGEIQRHIGVLPAQMSRVIRSLESKGDKPLIACHINPEDKRKIDVEITPAGRKAHQSYREHKLGSTLKILQSLDEDDRAEFMRILRLIRGNTLKDMSGK